MAFNASCPTMPPKSAAIGLRSPIAVFASAVTTLLSSSALKLPALLIFSAILMISSASALLYGRGNRECESYTVCAVWQLDDYPIHSMLDYVESS